MKIIHLLGLSLFLSCTKTEPLSVIFTREEPLPTRIVSNFLNFSTGDSLYPAGINRQVFNFVYLESDKRILGDKLYEQPWYREKIAHIARIALNRISADIPLSQEMLCEYSFDLKPYFNDRAIPAKFAWTLKELRY
ncbi:hypothetical protein WJU16_03070 [Chitinophaga pollutisoli]|uniref:Lipoprotein n=1 Tax=Chitinophaga pollutisoli TaxID=3133966 RepID=A0ABZ2YR53_9BACT